jgi:hypothetical protein
MSKNKNRRKSPRRAPKRKRELKQRSADKTARKSRRKKEADVALHTAKVNRDLLSFGNCYGWPDFVDRGYYVDRPFTCRDCGSDEAWRATQQKWWYEVAKGDLWTTAVRCAACRKKERQRKSEARQEQLLGTHGQLTSCGQIRELFAMGHSKQTASEMITYLDSDCLDVVRSALKKLQLWRAQESIDAVVALAERVFLDDHLQPAVPNVSATLRVLDLSDHEEWAIDTFFAARDVYKRHYILAFCGSFEYASIRKRLIAEWQNERDSALKHSLMKADLAFRNSQFEMIRRGLKDDCPEVEKRARINRDTARRFGNFDQRIAGVADD